MITKSKFHLHQHMPIAMWSKWYFPEEKHSIWISFTSFQKTY